MDKAKVAGALQEYEDAMTEFLTSVRARTLVPIFRLKLMGTPAYNDDVLRADLA